MKSALPTARAFHRSLWIALVAAYLATRLVRLDLLPLFADEGGYLSWGLRALHGRSPQDWLASVEDGKQPLFVWLLTPFLAVVPDALVAGRLASVVVGLGNLIVLAGLARRLYGPSAGLVAAALYVAAPAALIHDRMALYESLVALTVLLVLRAALGWAERPGPRPTVLLGLTMGAALLTKLSVLFFLVLVPPAVALWRPGSLRRWWLLGSAYALAAAVYAVVYLSPHAGRIAAGNTRYALGAAELAALPWGLWRDNAWFAGHVAVAYLGWPLALAAAGGLAWGVVRGGPAGRLAALWTLAPLLGLVATARVFYPRYAAVCLVVALLPAAAAIAALGRALAGRGERALGPVASGSTRRRWLVAGGTAAAAAPGLLFASALLTDPRRAPWVDAKDRLSDRWQYVQGNEAGYGLAEVVRTLADRARAGPIAVLATDSTGLPRDGLIALLRSHPNVELGFVAVEPAPDGWIRERESVDQRLARGRDGVQRVAAGGGEVYYVLSDAPGGEKERRFRELNPGLSPLLSVAKPDGRSRFQLYRLRWLDPAETTWLEPPARLGDGIVLRGSTLPAAPVPPGGVLRLALHWELAAGAAPPAARFTVFTHVVPDAEAAADRIWGQHDGEPAGAALPTTDWRPGAGVLDVHPIVIGTRTPPGAYVVLAGMYETTSGRRLPVLRGSGAGSDRVVLGRVTVAPL